MTTIFQRSSFKGQHRFFDFTDRRVRGKFFAEPKKSDSKSKTFKTIKDKEKIVNAITKASKTELKDQGSLDFALPDSFVSNSTR